MLRTAAVCEEGEVIWQDFQESHQISDYEVNRQVFCQDMKNSSKMREETAQRVRARDVGAPAILGSFACIDRKKDLYCLHPVVCHDVERKVDGGTP
jgi:hypothetical protein